MRTLLLAATLLLSVPVVASATLVPGDNDRTLTVAGIARTYRVHVPPGWTADTPAPVVIDLHGWSSNAAQQQSLSGLAAVSNREGFLVVWPQGIGNAWNAGVCCGNAGGDDVGFIRLVVDAVLTEANADPRRVYVTGLSNGGAMTHKLACEASDLFAAAAPMAFPLPYADLGECLPARPVPIRMVMGLTDALVPYENGSFGSAPATFARWRDLHGCTGTPDVQPLGEPARCETFAPAQCASGREVGLCSIVAQAFPGQFFDGHILYLNSQLNLAEDAWAFMQRHVLPAAFPADPVTLRGTVRLRVGRQRATAPDVAWNLGLAATWAAETERGTTIGGSTTTRGARRRLLHLDEAGRAALEAEIVARIEALTGTSGAAVALAPDATLRVRLDRAGTPKSLTASLRLVHPDGRRAGRLQVRLRRQRQILARQMSCRRGGEDAESSRSVTECGRAARAPGRVLLAERRDPDCSPALCMRAGTPAVDPAPVTRRETRGCRSASSAPRRR